MNQPDWVIGLAILAACFTMIGGAVGLVLSLESKGCSARWEKSGYESQWAFLQGCLVKQADGRWLPERMMRRFD